MKNILSPSILSADFAKLGEDMEAIKQAGAPWVHIDVMDGAFVPSISYGMPVIKSIRKVSDLFFDVHLMIVDPERYIDEFVESGADLITFHLEATMHPMEVIQMIHDKGLKAGISIKPRTPVEEIRPFLKVVDLVLIMSVEPGFGGQKYIEASTEKIRKARELITESGREIELEVDGGVGVANAAEILEAGANVLVAGSSVFKGDIAENTHKLLEIMK